MKKKYCLQLMTLLLSLILMVGCTQAVPIANPVENPAELTADDQFEVIRQAADTYLAAGKVVAISPEKLYQEYVQGRNPEYYLVDIRASADFVASNIRGSVNIPYAQTVSLKKLENLPADKTLVVIDYNGHWAAQTAATWNMLGFKAVPLQYGIQSWTKEQASTGYEAFPEKPLGKPLVTEVKELGEYALPELKMPEGKVQELVRLLSGTYLDRNYKGFILAEDLLAVMADGTSKEENYLVDIRRSEHYKLGHLADSVNIPLAELAKAEMLKRLSLDKKIVLIGYDGMDASQGSRILVTMGYNAVALKYGMSYWSGDEAVTGAEPIQSLVQEVYELAPLNYVTPSAGPAGCG